MFKYLLFLVSLTFAGGELLAAGSSGIVNFSTCVAESKYGKHEQEQLENIRKQWSSLIEETEKELKDLSAKFEDKDYMDGLSPEAETEMKTKYQTLSEDLNKYQNQLYQVLQQANYFFIQRMASAIAKASQTIAEQKSMDTVLNKEACFFHKSDMDITTLVIKEMDKNFEADAKSKAAENEKAAKDKEVAKVEEQPKAKK